MWNAGGTILTENTEVLSKKLSHCHFLHYNCHTVWRRTEPKLRWLEADDQLPEPWHSFLVMLYVSQEQSGCMVHFNNRNALCLRHSRQIYMTYKIV